jgi:hypothetical protein
MPTLVRMAKCAIIFCTHEVTISIPNTFQHQVHIISARRRLRDAAYSETCYSMLSEVKTIRILLLCEMLQLM